jgi:RimJ/RimL family protein N-acetyltransferase
MRPFEPAHYIVRPMDQGDLDTVSDWLQHVDDFSLFDRTLTLPPSKEAIRESWKSDLAAARFPAAYWFVLEGPDRTAVGIGGLQAVNYLHGDAVLPVLIARSARGRGLGLRVAAILLDVAFDRLRLRRVTTYFRSDNARTQEIVTRLGFREEGRLRQAWMVDGRYMDCIIVGILREEWQSSRAQLDEELHNGVVVRLGRAPEVIEGIAR